MHANTCCGHTLVILRLEQPQQPQHTTTNTTHNNNTTTTTHNHNNHNKHNKHNKQLSDPSVPFLCGVLSVMMASEQPGSGAAQRRRQRRLRSWLRHERMTVGMALAESTHHSSRGQTIAWAGVWGREMNYTATIRNPPTHQPELFSLEEEPGGSRPDRLFEVRPQEAVQRHTWSSLPTTLPGCRRLTFLCR